jgi:hypothetical protein
MDGDLVKDGDILSVPTSECTSAYEAVTKLMLEEFGDRHPPPGGIFNVIDNKTGAFLRFIVAEDGRLEPMEPE